MSSWIRKLTFWVGCAGVSIIALAQLHAAVGTAPQRQPRIYLPQPDKTGKMPLEQALSKRRSRRSFTPQPLTDQQLGQLCWAADGISDKVRQLRTAPSAGALYPLDLYVATADGLFKYLPAKHALLVKQTKDLRGELSRQALGQEVVADAAAVFIIVAEPIRSARKYGQRAWQYCLLEAGHIGQNILLEATAMSLASVPVGAFDEKGLGKLMRLPKGHKPVYLICVGNLRTAGVK